MAVAVWLAGVVLWSSTVLDMKCGNFVESWEIYVKLNRVNSFGKLIMSINTPV